MCSTSAAAVLAFRGELCLYRSISSVTLATYFLHGNSISRHAHHGGRGGKKRRYCERSVQNRFKFRDLNCKKKKKRRKSQKELSGSARLPRQIGCASEESGVMVTDGAFTLSGRRREINLHISPHKCAGQLDNRALRLCFCIRFNCSTCLHCWLFASGCIWIKL